ncbi:MAG: hypothetical protein ACOCU4_02520 [Alkalispirochaeta sp.]
MKLDRQDKENLSEIRFGKAREFLRDAQANIEETRDSLHKAEALLKQIDELRHGITDGT